MNRERVEKYIDVWRKYIREKNLIEVEAGRSFPLEQLENDIGISLGDFIIDILENLYNRYSSSISYIPVKFDNYSDYIIAPQNGRYSLEDFLLNRLLRSINELSYCDMSRSYEESSDYQYDFGTVTIDKNRLQIELKDVRQKKKLVTHEILHGLKTQFYDGDIFEADRYYQMKEELKEIFGSEINDFNKKNHQQNASKHSGIGYSSLWNRLNSNKYRNLELTNLDEILNELEAIDVSKDNYLLIADVVPYENYRMILTNPESSNTWITNYAFILEKLVSDDTLFTGLYLEPEIFYKEFNLCYTQIFQRYYDSNLSALEILLEQLRQIKNKPKNIDKHRDLLNVLYECIDKKYVLSGYNDKLRKSDIKRLGYRGLLEFVNGRVIPHSTLNYSDEYYTMQGIQKK